jgi:gliding motility-associated-like protein
MLLMKFLRISLLTLTFYCLSNPLFAQTLTAGFTADATKGCTPSLTVNFTNTSTGTGLTYSWDLGNGNSSVEKNPSATYTSAGTYTVKLTVTDASSKTATSSTTITVYSAPTAAFKANPTSGCSPLTTTFTDQSTKGSGTISAWKWDFRDGSTSTTQNPTKKYTTEGTFAVYLKVTDSNGCSSELEKTSYIDVANAPVVGFTPSTSSACKIPLSVSFTNTTTGKGTLTYDWSLGNSKTSTLKSPSTTYESYGTYTVKLTATSTEYGCSSSFEYPAVTITQVISAGTLTKDGETLNTKDTICSGTVTCTSSTTGTSSVYWSFGDGGYSYLSTATHNYNTAGTYTVKLIASPGTTCADTTSWTLTVEKVTASYSFTPTSGCVSPVAISFTNNSTGASSYKWTFPDGTASTSSTPSYSFTIPKDKDDYVIHTTETYPIVLVATSKSGCTSTSTQNFTVNLPTALFSVDKTEGCKTLTVNFTDNSTPSSNIASRKWIYGDNATETLTTTTATHNYTSAGDYKARLVVTDKSGCIDTSYAIKIKAGEAPDGDFSVTTNHSFYSDQLISISDLTPAADSADYWKYSINGVPISSCTDVSSPSFYYNSDTTTTLSVTQKVGYNGCFSEKTYTALLTNLGPISVISYTMDCSSPLVYNFTGIAKNADSYTWDFGDGSTNTSTLVPVHTYAKAGDYTVKLISNNDGHYNTDSVLIYVRNSSASFTYSSSGCLNSEMWFNGSASHQIISTCGDRYLWNFGDNTNPVYSVSDSISHSYSTRGVYTVSLTAIYENGCTSSASQSIRIISPYADIYADTTSGCNYLNVKFTDKSTKDNSTLVTWDWNFNDGTDSTVSQSGKTILKEFELPDGTTAKVYPVVLTVTDNEGCKGTDTVLIKVSKPSAAFTSLTDNQICYPDTCKLKMNSTGFDYVKWYFGDGTTDTTSTQTISHLYKTLGSYRVALKVSKYNCADSVSSAADYIQVQKADAYFIVSDSILNCPDSIVFYHTASMSAVDSGRWYFGDRGNTGTYDTQKEYNYNIPGTYTAKLAVYTSFGCADTFSRSLKIYGPYADFATSVRQACKGDSVLFALRDTSDIYKWKWDFGEGIVYSNVDSVNYCYKTVGQKTITLTYYSFDTTCYSYNNRSFTVEQVIAAIGVADTSVCEGVTIPFSNLSTGYTSFTWDMGNGVTSTDESPQQSYDAGTYMVSLSVSNDNSCKDTAYQTIISNPVPKITLTNDTVLCVGNSLQLSATGGTNVVWSPNKWLSDYTSVSPVTTADSTIQYNVVVSIDTTGCSAKDSVIITVQQKPVFTLTPSKDTTIFIADEVELVVQGNETYSYSWSPSKYLTCNMDCSTATVKPEDSITYYLTVKDLNNCFSDSRNITIYVKDTCTFDVAKAFTPEGTEENRLLKVQGKGIKQLLSYKIYNRWGNVVFETSDISQGWDGTYQGKLQSVDTYVYTISVLTFKGVTINKKGSVLLLR